MKNKLILFGIRVTMSFQTKAQNLIARLRSGAVKFYITLISAYKACVNGDSFLYWMKHLRPQIHLLKGCT